MNALEMLKKTETPTRIFGWDEDYQEMPSDHPVALAERYSWLAVMSSDREDDNDELMVIYFCSKLWSLRDRLDQSALGDMAKLLTALATAYPALAEMAIESIDGCEESIWQAYRMRLSPEVFSEEVLKVEMERMAVFDRTDEGFRSVLISECDKPLKERENCTYISDRIQSRKGSIAEA